MEATPVYDLSHRLQAAVGTILLGKEAAVELAVTTLLAGGHLLIEDHPGVGKTLLARTLARALDLPFQRLQCTADLLPADVVGTQIYHPRTGELTFRPGPIFTSVLLADELNRTPPRTQSALLECMSERRVTIDRETHELPEPFFVVATQNPANSAGTYPLPENQLDRFLMRIRLGYPDPAREAAIVAQEDGHRALTSLTPVASREELLAARAAVDRVRVDPDILTFVVDLANRTRRLGEAHLGVSTRGAQALHRACRARAVLRGRDYITPDDVRTLLPHVWGHRIAIRGSADHAEAVLHDVMRGADSPE